MLSVLFICMIWFVGKFFYIWLKSILGNHEITLYDYFLSSDIDWNGSRRINVYSFSIIDHWWHYSIGDVTFIKIREVFLMGYDIEKKKEKQLKPDAEP